MIKELLSDMDGFRKGNATAFQEVIDIYNRRLNYFAWKLINNKQEAEEIVSDAFAELFKRHQKFDNPKSIKSFLFITTRNKSFNHLKKMNKIKEGNKELYYLYGAEIDDGGLGAEVASGLIEKLKAALELLPPKRRKVVQLKLEGYSPESIARKLNTDTGNVRSHWYNALQQLRKSLTIIMFYLVFQIL